MALFAKSYDAAQADLAKAEAVVASWDAKQHEAAAEASALDATAGAEILADESAAEIISLKIQTLERKARAYGQAAGEARKALNDAHLALLEAEAIESEKAERLAVKRLEKHNEEIKALVDKIEALEFVRYVPAPEEARWGGDIREVKDPKSSDLANEAYAHGLNAAGIRYYLATGETTTEPYKLNKVLGTDFSAVGHCNVPSSVVAAKAAGLSPKQTAEA